MHVNTFHAFAFFITFKSKRNLICLYSKIIVIWCTFVTAEFLLKTAAEVITNIANTSLQYPVPIPSTTLTTTTTTSIPQIPKIEPHESRDMTKVIYFHMMDVKDPSNITLNDTLLGEHCIQREEYSRSVIQISPLYFDYTSHYIMFQFQCVFDPFNLLCDCGTDSITVCPYSHWMVSWFVLNIKVHMPGIQINPLSANQLLESSSW